MEIGENTPDVEYLEILSRVFSVSVNELLKKDPLVKNWFSISSNGIYIKDGNDEVIIEPGSIKVENSFDFVEPINVNKSTHINNENILRNKKINLCREIVFAISLAVTLIAYLTLGFIFTDGSYGWSTFWPLLFLPVVIESIFASIVKKTFFEFNITFLALFIYLQIGMALNIWHPTWVILLSIPLYYLIVYPFEKFQDLKTYYKN